MDENQDQIEPAPRSGVGCGLLIGILVSVVIMGVAIILFEPAIADEHFSLAAGMLIFYLALGGVAFAVMKYFNISMKALTGSIGRFKENIRLSGWVIPLIAISICTAILILAAFAAIDENLYHSYHELGDRLSWPAESPAIVHILMVISAVILAPVVEEYIFRGILLSSWTVKWGATRAIIVSSLIFAIFHIDPVGAFIAGVALCLIYFHTGSMLLVILIHMINNGLAVLAMFLLPDMFAVEAPGDAIRQLWYVIPVLALSLLIMWPMIRKYWPAKDALPPDLRSTE